MNNEYYKKLNNEKSFNKHIILLGTGLGKKSFKEINNDWKKGKILTPYRNNGNKFYQTFFPEISNNDEEKLKTIQSNKKYIIFDLYDITNSFEDKKIDFSSNKVIKNDLKSFIESFKNTKIDTIYFLGKKSLYLFYKDYKLDDFKKYHLFLLPSTSGRCSISISDCLSQIEGSEINSKLNKCEKDLKEKEFNKKFKFNDIYHYNK